MQSHNYGLELENLELVIYFPQIRTAVEIQGIHHGLPVEHFHRSREDFERQLEHDARKDRLCREQHVVLYQLTIFNLTQRRFEEVVRRLSNYILKTHTTTSSSDTHLRYGVTNTTWRRLIQDPPLGLFASAEQLSRAKAPHEKALRRKKGFWNVVRCMLKKSDRAQAIPDKYRTSPFVVFQ